MMTPDFSPPKIPQVFFPCKVLFKESSSDYAGIPEIYGLLLFQASLFKVSFLRRETGPCHVRPLSGQPWAREAKKNQPCIHWWIHFFVPPWYITPIFGRLSFPSPITGEMTCIGSCVTHTYRRSSLLDAPEAPEELRRLAWQTDQMRRRSENDQVRGWLVGGSVGICQGFFGGAIYHGGQTLRNSCFYWRKLRI